MLKVLVALITLILVLNLYNAIMTSIIARQVMQKSEAMV